MKKNKMNKNNNKKGIVITICLLILLFLVQSSLALNIEGPDQVNVQEGETIQFLINVTNNTGLVQYSKNIEEGNLTKINDSKAEYIWTTNLKDSNTYNLEITAEDDNNTKTIQIEINVENTNEYITLIEKSITETINEDIFDINLETDKEATCKYSLKDEEYKDMQYTFSKTNNEETLHEGKTPKLTQGSHTIFIQCKDEFDNTLEDTEQLDVTVNLKPTARIELEPNPPIRSGKIKVTLTSSEDLISAPELQYFYNDAASPRQITLIGSGSYWTGYLIVEDAEKDRVGTFTFKGYDLTNKEGTEITDGKIFLVDKKKPYTIKSVDIRNRDKSLKILWTYDGSDKEDIDKFKIYKRTSSGGVDYTDYYDSTTKEYFIDDDVEYNEAYYYRVAAVDEAGNEGELSKEVFITHTPILEDKENKNENDNSNSENKNLDDKLLYILQDKKDEINKFLIDIEEAEKVLNRAEGKEKVEAVQILELLKTVKIQKDKISKLYSQLSDLENKDLTKTEFEKQTGEIIEEAKTEWKNTPRDIEVVDSASYEEFSDDAETEEYVRKWIEENSIDLSDSEKQAFIEKNKQLQDLLTVNTEIIKVKVSYVDSSKYAVVFNKKLTTDKALTNIRLAEKIPTTIEASGRVEFTDNMDKLKDTEYYSLKLDSLSERTFTYSFWGDIDLILAKSVKTIILEESDLKENLITGNVAAGNSINFVSNPLFYPILLGILMTVALMSYYFISVREHDEKNHLSQKLLFKKTKEEKEKRHIIPEKEAYKDHKKLDFNELSTKKEKENNNEKWDENTDENVSVEQKGNVISLNINKDNNKQNENRIEQQKITKEETANEKVSKEILDEAYKELKHINDNKHELGEIWNYHEIKHKTEKLKKLANQVEDAALESYAENIKQVLKDTLKNMESKNDKRRSKSKKDTKKVFRRAANVSNTSKPKNENKLLDIFAPEDKAFYLQDGKKLRSLRELKDYLKFMSDETFYHHVNNKRNDFANWTEGALNLKTESEKIRKTKNKTDLLFVLESF